MASYSRITLLQAARLLEQKECSSVQLVSECISQIQSPLLRKVNAFVLEKNEDALQQAKQSDERRKEGNTKSIIDGIPIAVKDNFCTKGEKTTCSSKILKDFVAPYDATVVKKLKDAGAIIIGKTNMDEFGMGSANTFSSFGPVLNPWDQTRVAGGSSGGSAAAVASFTCFGALGSDTGGSVRLPAAYCGVVGLKPTYGLLSRYGLVAYASSLDVPGIFGRTVDDTSCLLDILAGEDNLDSTNRSVEKKKDYMGGDHEQNLTGMTVGVPQEFFVSELPKEIVDVWKVHLRYLIELGAKVISIDMPSLKYALPSYYILAPAEASSNLARYGGVHYGNRSPDAETIEELYTRTRTDGFGEEVKRRLMVGAFVLSRSSYESYYVKAQQVRRLIRQDFERAFGRVDVLIAPTAVSTARKLSANSNPVEMYADDVLTVPASLAGVPAMSIPAGVSAADGLPLGLQLMAADFQEEKMLRVARMLEKALQS
eukprot:TRINITY_DN10324_c0_g1_i4.p1 TRINITY_DN10324_c0_g1~~TRINITY_DN10324_c0_g1_i4.p1  ORF type:complete len:484 (-),score=82.33 TRINITY_DN10324_c0_g1_i4:60-1511(-)